MVLLCRKVIAGMAEVLCDGASAFRRSIVMLVVWSMTLEVRRIGVMALAA
jgi:hypothetical protein